MKSILPPSPLLIEESHRFLAWLSSELNIISKPQVDRVTLFIIVTTFMVPPLCKYDLITSMETYPFPLCEFSPSLLLLFSWTFPDILASLNSCCLWTSVLCASYLTPQGRSGAGQRLFLPGLLALWGVFPSGGGLSSTQQSCGQSPE